jgi:hypothetical protein
MYAASQPACDELITTHLLLCAALAWTDGSYGRGAAELRCLRTALQVGAADRRLTKSVPFPANAWRRRQARLLVQRICRAVRPYVPRLRFLRNRLAMRGTPT